MYSIQQYVKDNISFTNSLIIKFSGISYVRNKELVDLYGYTISDNIAEHKYYLNLSGVKHNTNTDVKIRLLEDNTEYSLTVDLLNNNLYSKNELLLFSDYYKELISNYPNDVDYIRGCIIPVDINSAIDARDGTILGYSKHYVDDSELSLMRELNMYTQSFFVRWYIKDYLITDELYSTSVMGSLLSTIPSHVMNIRLKKVKTNEVHSFHLEHFFRSRLDIWTELAILNKDTVIWLYNNLDYLIYNLGKNETINLIGSKVLDANNVGMGVYKLKNGLQDKLDDTNPLNANLTKADNYLQIEGMNLSYIVNDNEKVSIETTTELQLIENNPFGIDKDTSYIYNNYVVDKLKDVNLSNQNTKILDIDYGALFKTYGGDLFLSTMDTWLTTSATKTYINILDYIDPNTNAIYKIDTLTGYYLIIYHMLAITGDLETPVEYVYHTKSLDYGITVNELINNVHNKDMFEPIATLIVDNVPNIPNEIHNTENFNLLLSNIKNLLIKVWLLDSNINNASLSSNIKHAVRRLYVEGKYQIPNSDGIKNITSILFSLGVDVKLTETYDHFESIKTIFKLFTGNELSDSIAYNNNTEIIKTLVKKLTSYTVEVISSVNDAETLYSPYSTIEAYVTNEGLINVTQASVKSAYESDIVGIKAEGNDFKEGIKTTQGTTNVYASMCTPVRSYLAYTPEVDITANTLTVDTTVEIVNSCPDMWKPSLVADGNTFNSYVDINYSEDVPTNDTMVNYETSTIASVDNMLELETNNGDPVTIVEIINSGYFMWKPGLIVEGNNLTPWPDYTAYFENTRIDTVSVSDSTPTTIAYTDDPTADNTVDVLNSPNTIIEIT